MERLDSIIGTILNELLKFVKFNDDVYKEFIYFDSCYCEHLIEGNNKLWSKLEVHTYLCNEVYMLPNYKML